MLYLSLGFIFNTTFCVLRIFTPEKIKLKNQAVGCT